MICRIEVEGIDKTGKDTLVGYLDYMSGRTIPVGSRGILSTLAYADIYNRVIALPKEREMIYGNINTLIVYLEAEIPDLEIRYKITNEKMLDMEQHIKIFRRYANRLSKMGIKVLRFNTSKLTPYQIAQEVINCVEEENKRCSYFC